LIASVLIEGGYVTLTEVLILVLHEDINKEIILNIIYIAYNYGEKIPHELINRLECIPNKSIFVINLINLVAKKGYCAPIDDLSSKKNIKDIYGELEIKIIYENGLKKRIEYFEELMSSLKS
jgi:hypothetical protein